jgi:hypothetical protein
MPRARSGRPRGKSASPRRNAAPATPRKGGGAPSPRGTRFAVAVTIDGKSLPLKEFLHDMIGGSVCGLLEALRDVDAPKRMTVDVRRLPPPRV